MSHVQRDICANYTLGFCPLGPNCDKEHVKSLLKGVEGPLSLTKLANFPIEMDWVDRLQHRTSGGKDDSTSEHHVG